MVHADVSKGVGAPTVVSSAAVTDDGRSAAFCKLQIVVDDYARFELRLPTTAWTLEVGTFLLRTESELVLKSRQVVPGRLRSAGFCFSYPEWTEAARDLVTRWRERTA